MHLTVTDLKVLKPICLEGGVVIKMNDFLIGIALLHLVLITYIVAAAPNLERVVLLVTISLKGRGYYNSAGLSRLRELLQWVR